MRALERRQQAQEEGESSEEEDEEDEADLQAQLKIVKELAMKDFIAALENLKYSKRSRYRCKCSDVGFISEE